MSRPFEPDEAGPARALRDPAGPRPHTLPREAAPEEHLACLVSPQSFEADQYRVLRQLLDRAHEETGFKVLAITSPSAGDGKTTTAINLAATLAQTPGCRALLVDTDLRRPFVAANLGLEASGPGLVDAVLDEHLDLAAVIRKTPHGLAVVTAGSPSADAYGVLESPRVSELLDQARSSYDYVVLDMPPVLLVPDCRLMSQWVDRYLLVVAAHRTPRKLLAEALSALEQTKVLGIVFNGDDRPTAGYYKQYYTSRGRSSRKEGSGWRWWPGRRRPRAQPWP